MKRVLFLIVALGVVLIGARAGLGCDLCRDAVATNAGSGSESASLNFNESIFLMLGTLFAVMGLIGRVMYKAMKGPTITRGFPLGQDPLNK